MWKFLKREFFDWWTGFRDWVNAKDSCELCGNEIADNICVGCDRRICDMCNSGYYEDAELCQACRHDITPEEEEEDRKLAAELDGDTE
jgi:ribosome-binding protein aMBF1 (putative translation factor)